MEHQASTGDPPTDQSGSHHRGNSPKASSSHPAAKRERSVADAPAFKDWVGTQTNGANPRESPMRKGIELVASAAADEAAASEIQVRIEKLYKVRVEKTGAVTHVSGELHLVPWGKYSEIIDGLIAVIADSLKVSAAKIRKESDMPATTEGTGYPAFTLGLPKTITDDEQRTLNVAIHSFRQRLRGQDESLTKDLFADANPEAAAIGARAAEGVRRMAGQRRLPQALTVNAGGRDAPIKLDGRIGDHPDPEQDGVPVLMTGRVVAILTEDHKVWIRCQTYKDKEGREVSTSIGKRFVIQYSDDKHKADVLKLPLGQFDLVTFNVIPRTGRGEEKLILKTIGKASDPGSAAGSSNTTQ